MDAGTSPSDLPDSTASASVQSSFPRAAPSEPRNQDAETHVPQSQLPLVAGVSADGDDRNRLRYVSVNHQEYQVNSPASGLGGEAYANGGFGGVPASAASIAVLEYQEYGAEEAEPRKKKRCRRRRCGRGDDEEATTATVCAICLVNFAVGDDLNVMPCAHRFHEACLIRWLALSRLCPCCRFALLSEEDEAKKRRGVDEQGDGKPTRRSSRVRQANVRLFGSEWTSGNDEE